MKTLLVTSVIALTVGLTGCSTAQLEATSRILTSVEERMANQSARPTYTPSSSDIHNGSYLGVMVYDVSPAVESKYVSHVKKADKKVIDGLISRSTVNLKLTSLGWSDVESVRGDVLSIVSKITLESPGNGIYYKCTSRAEYNMRSGDLVQWFDTRECTKTVHDSKSRIITSKGV